jgi:hypothetical protein
MKIKLNIAKSNLQCLQPFPTISSDNTYLEIYLYNHFYVF